MTLKVVCAGHRHSDDTEGSVMQVTGILMTLKVVYAGHRSQVTDILMTLKVVCASHRSRTF